MQCGAKGQEGREERERIEIEKRARREVYAGGREKQLKAAVESLKNLKKKAKEGMKGKSAGGKKGGGKGTVDESKKERAKKEENGYYYQDCLTNSTGMLGFPFKNPPLPPRMKQNREH